MALSDPGDGGIAHGPGEGRGPGQAFVRGLRSQQRGVSFVGLGARVRGVGGPRPRVGPAVHSSEASTRHEDRRRARFGLPRRREKLAGRTVYSIGTAGRIPLDPFAFSSIANTSLQVVTVSTPTCVRLVSDALVASEE